MAFAYLARNGTTGNFYLRTNAAGQRRFINLKTTDPAAAQAALGAKKLELSNRPWANGHTRWQSDAMKGFRHTFGKSRVSLQNYAAARRAIATLNDAERWAFLFLPHPKVTALQCLGRIPDTAMMRLAADEVCEGKLSSKQAISFLRQVNNRRRAGKPERLANALRGAIREYRTLHPETPAESVALALRTLAGEIESPRPREQPRA